MKLRSTCLAIVVCVFGGQVASAALMDITRPGDPVELVNGFNQNDGDAGAPPAGEPVSSAIDDVGQKYLNFLDLSSGFSVTPSANSGPVVGMRLYTANDAETRDPASYQLFGSNDSIGGPWEVVSSGALALPSDRNEGGATVAIPPGGNFAAAMQELTFDNDIMYTHYQVVFPTLKDAQDANSMQIGEVELLAEVVPEPASIVLTLCGLLGVCGITRRRR